MSARKLILAVMVFTFFGLNAQDVDSLKLSKHELGVSLGLKTGRFFPGLQYYYNLNSKNQLGINFSMYGSRVGESEQVLHPSLSLSYRRLLNVSGGLRAYVAPTASYELINISNQGRFSRYGLGLDTGFEYDFSQKRVPLILGVGVQPTIYRAFGRTQFGFNPSINLRLKF